MKMIKNCFLVLLLSVIALGGLAQPVTPENALQRYLSNGDNAYKWEEKNTYKDGDVTVTSLLLTSQTWRNITWRHQLVVISPDRKQYDGALLFVTGGSNKDEMPNWSNKKDDRLLKALSDIARKNKAVVALVKQVPNQPLYGDLTEDALISYTLHNFKKDKDYSWPLLFPMVKSAVKAMDAVQEFSKQKLNFEVNRFVVSGASKRGWTTWLTGSIRDKRVVAIAPMVIDILNMPVSLDYQIRTWGDYSIQIEDYVKLGIPQSAETTDGKEITTMVDPYSYRKNLVMPKMIFMGTNDEYWVVDNIKNYYKDIPGKNLIHYVPNAGHDLGGGAQAMEALGAFLGNTLQNKAYPECTWKVKPSKKGIELTVGATSDLLVDAILWSADSRDKDFRDDKWSSRKLGISGKSKVSVKEAFPASGYRAFYLDLKYKDPNGGDYTTSTRMFVSDTKSVFVD